MKKTRFTMVFIPVGKCDKMDLYAFCKPMEFAEYIAERCERGEIVMVEDCLYDPDELNSWDDEVLEYLFGGDNDEYKDAIRYMNTLLGIDDADSFLKARWAFEVRGGIEEFTECYLNKAYEKLNKC